MEEIFDEATYIRGIFRNTQGGILGRTLPGKTLGWIYGGITKAIREAT